MVKINNMKLRFFLTGVIFVFSGLVARGQVTEALYQGFETGEVSRVNGVPPSSITYSTAIHAANGSRALQFTQSTTEDVELILDTLDFTNDLTLRYITLEFDHICYVQRNSSTDLNMGTIWFKRANQTDWTRASATYYNRTEGGSTAFEELSAFNNHTYDEWTASPMTNAGLPFGRAAASKILYSIPVTHFRCSANSLAAFFKTVAGLSGITIT